MKAKFICFIGMDGSGKTTISKRVVEELNKKNEKSGNFIYVHSLIEPKLLKPFMALGRPLLTKGKSREIDYVEFYRTKRDRLSKYPFFFTFYKIILFFDYWPQIAHKIVIPLFRGKNIVSDRYIYDTLINLSLNMNYDVLQIERLINNFASFFPMPDITFLIDLPEEVAFSRKDDILTIEHLKERRSLYKGLARSLAIPVLDGTRDVNTLVDEVMENLRRIVK